MTQPTTQFGALGFTLPRTVRVIGALLCIACASWQTGCRAEQPWPLWQHYKAYFLDSSGRIVDHTAADRTTSEGQAYAMFFALVANDRPAFDKLLRWTEDNLAGGDLTARLPAWSWGKTASGEWKQLDTNSASDADLWLAYDCLEAGRLWHDSHLQKLGAVLSTRIAHDEVALTSTSLTVLLPAPRGFQPNATTYLLNPSYAPPQLLARLQGEMPGGPWTSLQADLPKWIAQPSGGGFAMDWLRAGDTITAASPPADSAATSPEPVGSYDAVRVYLWLGMAHKATPGVQPGLTALSGMHTYLQTHILPPLRVDSSGKVLQPDGTLAFSAAILPYLDAWGDTASAKHQTDRLAAAVDPGTGLYGHTPAYYDQNLILFSLGWREHRFRFQPNGMLKTSWR